MEDEKATKMDIDLGSHTSHSGADLMFLGPQPHRGQSSKNMDQSQNVVWCASLPRYQLLPISNYIAERNVPNACMQMYQDSNAGQHQQKRDALPSCPHATAIRFRKQNI